MNTARERERETLLQALVPHVGHLLTEEALMYMVDDLLDRLGVIVPPCQVGDKIYFIYPKQYQDDTIKEGVVTQLALATKFEKSMFPGESVFLFEEIGEKLFFSREAAEQALKEVRENGGS